MRTNLQVPYAEKDDAKRLGARWDATRKVWYVENKADMAAFARWLPAGNATPGGGGAAAQPQAQQQTAGITIVGSQFVEQARICSCLPWEACDKCQSA